MGISRTMTKADLDKLKDAYVQLCYSMKWLAKMRTPGRTLLDLVDNASFVQSDVLHARRLLREVLERHGAVFGED